MHYLIGTILAVTVILLIYRHIGFTRITACYRHWLDRGYWNLYNTVEAFSWIAKIIVIVPGLVFHVHLWQSYILTLISSIMLIWVSEWKMLPTLVLFNSLWVWISMIVICEHLLV